MAILAFIWACIILIFCGYPGSGLPHVSFQFILPLDKSIHIFLFGTLCFLIQLTFRKCKSGTTLNRFPVFYAFTITTLYGILIEFLQRYVFIGRSFEGMDIVADASGAFLVVLYYWLKAKYFFLFENNLNEIVFEEKNKRYGAYFLRQRYTREVIKAFILAVLLVSIIFGFPFLAGLFEVQSIVEEVIEVNSVHLQIPPAFDTPYAELVAPPQIKEASKPKIVKDTPKINPVNQEEAVVPNPNARLTELFEKTKRDTLLAQKDSLALVPESTDVDKEKLKIVVDALPVFPGGPEAFHSFLHKNMTYPVLAKKSGIAGTVVISFIVGVNGIGNQFKIVRGLPGGCNEETLRVLALMPSWIPGKRRGISIPFMMVLPLDFALR